MPQDGLISTIANGWLQRGLDVTELRRRTSASNMANVSTPGYQAQRVSFEETLQRVGITTAPVRTHRGHLGGARVTAEARVVNDESADSPNGVNNVDVEKELAVIGWNRVRNEALTRFTSSQVRLLRDAIGRRG